MKLFFFGGCFDPPHEGHIRIIEYCLNLCDKFILMPTTKSPLKKSESSTHPNSIIEMLQLIINEYNFPIEIDKYDFNRSKSGPTYSIDTIQYLDDKYSDSSITMVLGADQLLNIKKWKKYREIIDKVHIVSFNRNKSENINLSDLDITWIDDFDIDVSSEKIREYISKGKLNQCKLSSLTKEYIVNNNLYGLVK